MACSLAIPLAAFAGFRAVERLHTEQRALSERSRAAAVGAARSLSTEFERSGVLLSSVSHLLDVHGSIARNDSILRALFQTDGSQFSNVWLVDTAGYWRGGLVAPTPDAARLPVDARELVHRAAETRTVAVAAARRSKIFPGAPFVFPFAIPLRDARGQVSGVMGAAMLMDSIDVMRMASDLPKNSVITLMDGQGRVLLRSADMDSWSERTFASNAELQRNWTSSDAARTVTSIDGTERLVGHAAVPSINAFLYVGIPTSATLLIAQQQFVRDAVLALLATLLGVLIAVVIAGRISGPIIALTADARALTAGERGHRSHMSADDEVGVLARTLNQLADAAEDREHALEESEERYRQLFNTNPLPLVAWLHDTGHLQSMNDAALTFYGIAHAAIARHRVTDLFAAREHDRLHRLPPPSPQMIQPEGTWWQQAADGSEREVEMVLGAFRREGSSIVVALMIDLTERHEAQRALEASREALRQSQKMEALGSFAGGIAHDFNNYLTAIITNAELLREEYPSSSPTSESEEILRAARRAADLTQQILVFSRRQVVEDVRLDVHVVLREVELLLHRVIGEHITMQLVLAPVIAPIMFDRGRLEQVLMNLAANARDAMPRGGTLTVRTRLIEDNSTSRFMQLTVEDTGIGMSADVQVRAFEPFFSTKERGRGTGLGLAMVYRIVTGAGGNARIESSLGQGTRVTITLPAVTGEHAIPAVAMPSREVRGGNECILLLEDDDAVRRSVEVVLSRAGYRVLSTTGADPQQAVRLLREHPTLLLTDVVMPGNGGPEMANRLRVIQPTLRVLYMSGYADDDVLLQGIEGQTVAFLAKPFANHELLHAVRQALDRTTSDAVY